MPVPPTRRRTAARRALALAAVGAVLVGGCAEGPGSTVGGAAPASGTPPAPALGTVDGTVATTKLPVYWVGEAEGRQLLFSEFRDAPEGSRAADPIAAAAEVMAGEAPGDPDYRTLWNPVDRIGTSTSPDGTITVDLPARAFREGLTDGQARLALQQLAHTVTAAADTAGLLPERSRAQVVVLVDGKPGEEVFGSLRLDGPLRPDEGLEAPIWLVDPQHGARADGRLTISGRVLEGVRGCRWTVTEKGGDPAGAVASGPVSAAPSDGPLAQFRTEVVLDPGAYEVSVLGRDVEGRTVVDDKDVVVGAP